MRARNKVNQEKKSLKKKYVNLIYCTPQCITAQLFNLLTQ